MTAAHSDSPTFYVKNDALEGDKRYVRLAVEGYGGMNCASWLDRPLTVAGRAVVRTPAGVEGRLVYLDRDLLTIPSLAIHQQRDVNRGHDYNAQKDMQPLYALAAAPPSPPCWRRSWGWTWGTSWPPTWCSAPGRRRCASGRRVNSSRPPH